MKAKRTRHSAAFKPKSGIRGRGGRKTVSQLAREYAVHPTQVTQWKATIRDHLPELFEPGQPGTEDQEPLIAQLHQKIGQLTVDLDWLKATRWTRPFVDAWEAALRVGRQAPLISNTDQGRSSPLRCLSTRWNRPAWT